ncbi:hypothetical protein ES703_110730 [subsurface metagenome]
MSRIPVLATIIADEDTKSGDPNVDARCITGIYDNVRNRSGRKCLVRFIGRTVAVVIHSIYWVACRRNADIREG